MIGQNRRKQGIAVFFRYAEADFTFGVRCSQGGDHLIEDFDHLACDWQQLFTAWHQRNAPSMAIEQLVRHGFFELLHLKADGGLRPTQTRRASTDAASLGNGQEAAQQVAIELGERVSSLLISAIYYIRFFNGSVRSRLLSKEVVMSFALPNVQKPIMGATAAVLAVLAALTWPQRAQETLHFVLHSFLDVALMIAIGLLVSAWVAASGAATITARWFKGRPVTTIVIASEIGTVTPVCGERFALPSGFLTSGVPLAPIMAFWLSSPVNGPTMLIATWALLGPEFAIGKMLAAFALGVFSGTVTALLVRTQMVQNPLRPQRLMGNGQCGACTPTGFSFRIWQDPARVRVFGANLFPQQGSL